jgi:hypothetical protein
MRISVAIFAAAAILLAGAPVALAKDATQQFSGQISQIDTVGKTLAVQQESKNPTKMTFAVASDAKIMAGFTAKSLGELKVGEHVKVSYADVGSKHEAQRIEVTSAKTATAKPYRKPSAK